MPTAHRRAHGQFFTTGNPFVLAPFRAWMARADLPAGTRVLEPFAGANAIPALMAAAGFDLAWDCFDLDPPAPSAHGHPITRRDTLARFPRGYALAITNPPYLARNSAARRRLPFPATAHDDLYKHALATALAHVPHLAAIVPESLLTAGVFHARLDAVVSLPWAMFADTSHPVCLALFSPKPPGDLDFLVYSGARRLGRYSRLSRALPAPPRRHPWRFNDPRGSIGLRAVDGHRGPSIAFVPGADIPASRIKASSRALTRIGGAPEGADLAELIGRANALLDAYRARTRDVGLTPFKGVRADGQFRRRLDFATARALLDAAASP